METIVFLDRGTVQVAIRPPALPHRWLDYEATSPEQTIPRLSEATVAVTNKVKLREAELGALPRLKFIAETATGYDNIDLEACGKRKIGVANVPGYARDSVPEHVFMMMLALRRNLPRYQDAVAAGRWQQSPIPPLLDYPVNDLRGAVLGLVGYGDLAKGVETRAKAFGMEILISERKGAAVIRPGRTSFPEVLRKADIVSLHVPMTPDTRGFIGQAELQSMKKGAILINTARGGVVDEQALAAALRSGHLGGAGVDVLREEPPRYGNPLLESGLPNLIVTPHIAWSSRRALETLAEEIILNIEAFFKGERRNRIV